MEIYLQKNISIIDELIDNSKWVADRSLHRRQIKDLQLGPQRH